MDIELHIDYEKINKGFVDLNKASAIAARNTLNILAANTRKFYIQEVKKNMILRNNYTTRGIVFDKAVGENLSSMASLVGAKAPYMSLQEEGGTRRPKRGSHLGIPQDPSRGGSKKRAVSRSFYLKSLNKRKIKGPFKKNISSPKARLVAMAYVAKTQTKVLKHRENMYAVHAFNKMNNSIKFKKTHLYNMTEKTTKVRGKFMLKKAVENKMNNAQAIYNGQMSKLLHSKTII